MAQGYVDKELFVSSTLLAMDFSNVGAKERAGNAFRAHVQWYVAGFFLQFPFGISLEKRLVRSISRTADFVCLVALPFRG